MRGFGCDIWEDWEGWGLSLDGVGLDCGEDGEDWIMGGMERVYGEDIYFS